MGIRSIFWKVISGRAPENGGWVDSMQVDHFDPYTPGQLTKNFTATVADEISVTRGTTVKALYRDDQWIYVQVSDGRRGFVPQTYCKLLLNNDRTGKRGEKKKFGSVATLDRKWDKSNLQRFIDSLPVHKEEGEVFKMDPICESTILHDFTSSNSDDLTVKSGENVTILNLSDPDWIFVRNSENLSGFVPTENVKIPEELANRPTKEKWENENLLVVEAFSGRSPLDLTVRAGDWVKCAGRPVDDWLWAVRVADEKQGFIPNKTVILATDL